MVARVAFFPSIVAITPVKPSEELNDRVTISPTLARFVIWLLDAIDTSLNIGVVLSITTKLSLDVWVISCPLFPARSV